MVLDGAPEEKDPEADASSDSDMTIGTSDAEEWHITHATSHALPSGEMHCDIYIYIYIYIHSPRSNGYSTPAACAASAQTFLACKHYLDMLWPSFVCDLDIICP